MDYENFIKYKKNEEEGTVFRFVLNNLETEMIKEKFKDLEIDDTVFSGIDKLMLGFQKILNLYFLSDEDGICKDDKRYDINIDPNNYSIINTYEGSSIKDCFLGNQGEIDFSILNDHHKNNNDNYKSKLIKILNECCFPTHNISNAFEKNNFYYLNNKDKFNFDKSKSIIKKPRDFLLEEIGITKNYNKFKEQFQLILKKFTVLKLNLRDFEWIKIELQGIINEIEYKDKIKGSKNINIELKNKLIEGLEELRDSFIEIHL